VTSGESGMFGAVAGLGVGTLAGRYGLVVGWYGRYGLVGRRALRGRVGCRGSWFGRGRGRK
jgi:hypothetical protein